MTAKARNGLILAALITLVTGLVLLTVYGRPAREDMTAEAEVTFGPVPRGGAEPDMEPSAESPTTVAPPTSPGRNELSVEGLLRLPEEFRRELDSGSGQLAPDAPGTQPGGRATRAPKSLTPDWVKPSLSVESERVEGHNPSADVEATNVKAGVTLSPGKQGDPSPDVSISVQGGVRQEVSDKEPDQPQRSPSVGVRVEVPWPPPREREPAENDAND